MKGHKCQDRKMYPFSQRGCGVCGDGSEDPSDSNFGVPAVARNTQMLQIPLKADAVAALVELEKDFTEHHDLAKKREKECAKEQNYNEAAQSQTEATGYAYAALRVKRELERLRTASDGSPR